MEQSFAIAALWVGPALGATFLSVHFRDIGSERIATDADISGERVVDGSFCVACSGSSGAASGA